MCLHDDDRRGAAVAAADCDAVCGEGREGARTHALQCDWGEPEYVTVMRCMTQGADASVRAKNERASRDEASSAAASCDMVTCVSMTCDA